MSIKNILIPAAVLLFALLLSGCRDLGDSITETASLKLSEVKELIVDVSSANVEIIKEERNDIYVEFETYERGDKLRTHEGKVSKIETYSNKLMNVNINSDYKLRVYIPTDYVEDLSLDLSSGNVTMTDFNLNAINCDLSSGSLNFDHLHANSIKLEVSSGNVDFDSVSTNKLKVDISSGDVTLNDFTGKIIGGSSSGKLSVKYSEVMDDIDYSASSGTITIDYSKVDVNAEFDLSTSSGSIKNDLDFDNFKENDDGDHITGTIGKGEYNVDLSVSSGNIELMN